MRITEVEAYGGPVDSVWPDPCAHTWPGITPRNRVMFGPAGHLYVYQSYGIHLCMNVTAGPDGEGGGVLLRAAALESGEAAVRSRRGDKPKFTQLLSGPGNVGTALGVTKSDYGLDLFDPCSRIQLRPGNQVVNKQDIHAGPRVGVRAASARKWRMWLPDPSVSKYRAHAKADGLE